MNSLLRPKILKIQKKDFLITFTQKCDFITINVGNKYEGKVKSFVDDINEIKDSDVSFSEDENKMKGTLKISNILKLILQVKTTVKETNEYKIENSYFSIKSETEKTKLSNMKIEVKKEINLEVNIKNLSVFPSGNFITLNEEIKIWDKDFKEIKKIDVEEKYKDLIRYIYIIDDDNFIIYNQNILKFFKEDDNFNYIVFEEINSIIYSISILSNNNDFVLGTENGIIILESQEQKITKSEYKNIIKSTLILEDLNIFISLEKNIIKVRKLSGNLSNLLSSNSLIINEKKSGDYIIRINKNTILVGNSNSGKLMIYNIVTDPKPKIILLIEIEPIIEIDNKKKTFVFNDILIMNDGILLRGDIKYSSFIMVYDIKTFNHIKTIENGEKKVKYNFLKLKKKNEFINYTNEGKIMICEITS